MANILILYHQPLIGNFRNMICFYESFIKSLKNYNNNVLAVNVLFLKEYNQAVITKLSKNDKNKFIQNIKNFNANIIFAFNNQIVKEIIDNTNCPICACDADSVDLFCKDANFFFKTYQDRYYFFSFAYGWESENRYLELGLKKQNIAFLHLSTSVNKENLEKDINISFIGTKFIYDGRYEINRRNLYQLIIKSYINNEQQDYNNILLANNDNLTLEEIYGVFDSRTLVLNLLLDLGLNLYGLNWWVSNNCHENILLHLAYINEPKYSLQHNQDIYNSSKINLSISHPQCRGYAFPWRVYDIMASNGLLISSYSKLLEEQTRGFVKIPMYKNPYDVRDLCKYALNNPNYCEDIISASNDFIEKYGRWVDNFEIISNKTGIKLTTTINQKQDRNFKIAEFEYSADFAEKLYNFKINFYGFLHKKSKSKHYKEKLNNYKQQLKHTSFMGIADYFLNSELNNQGILQ